MLTIMTQKLFLNMTICTNIKSSIGVLVKRSMPVFISIEMLMVFFTELLHKETRKTLMIMIQKLFPSMMICTNTRNSIGVLEKKSTLVFT